MAEDNNQDAWELAKASSTAMHSRDYCAQALGIEPQEVSPGFARLTMTVRKDMVNGHDICHGGMIFSLADTTFAHACNSRNEMTVASGCQIDYLNPARLDDVLTAVAEERILRGRTGVYDITVHNQDQVQIALFRGRSHRLNGPVIIEENA